MDKNALNKWAAEFVGEEDDMVAGAITAQWYTTQPGAAMVVLAKMASEGSKVELEIEDKQVEVSCDGYEETGTTDDLALLITTACWRCDTHG